MNFSSISKLSDLKSCRNDYKILYNIAIESGLYWLWCESGYRCLSNFMKYKFGILVRQGYVFCKNDFAFRIVSEFASIPDGNIIVMKGLF